MPTQVIPIETLLRLKKLGLPQGGTGNHVPCTGSGVEQRTVYQPTFEELYEFLIKNVQSAAQKDSEHKHTVTVACTQLQYGSHCATVIVKERVGNKGGHFMMHYKETGKTATAAIAAAITNSAS